MLRKLLAQKHIVYKFEYTTASQMKLPDGSFVYSTSNYLKGLLGVFAEQVTHFLIVDLQVRRVNQELCIFSHLQPAHR